MRLIIDTDAGVDDALAMMLAFVHPTASIEAITTVTGNTDVDSVVKNVLTIQQVMGADVPVYRGADLPLISGWMHTTADIHGRDGLGDWVERPQNKRTSVESEHAAVALVRLANQYPNELTLVVLGPMTNIALAVRLDPTFPAKIKRLVFMGGTTSAVGNTEVFTAEFNIWVDPEAAHIVLDSFKEAEMVSWETTLRHPWTWEQFDRLAGITSTPYGRFFNGITAFWSRIARTIHGFSGFLLPDPLAMAVALEPELVVRSERRFMAVELNGKWTRGETIIDYPSLSKQSPNTQVIHEIDHQRLYEMFEQLLSEGKL
jgi:purine nucleosidase